MPDLRGLSRAPISRADPTWGGGPAFAGTLPQAPMKDVKGFEVFVGIWCWKEPGRCEVWGAAPEDRALQGCNPSAACGRYTAGSGPLCPGPVLPAPLPRAKSHLLGCFLSGAVAAGAAGVPRATARNFGPGFKLLSVRGLWLSRLHYGLSDSHSSESKRFHLSCELWPVQAQFKPGVERAPLRSIGARAHEESSVERKGASRGWEELCGGQNHA